MFYTNTQAEEDRRILDKAWSSPQVTAECRQQFTNFGIEAIIALLTEVVIFMLQLPYLGMLNLEFLLQEVRVIPTADRNKLG